MVELVDGALCFWPRDGILCMVPLLYDLGFHPRARSLQFYDLHDGALDGSHILGGKTIYMDRVYP